jgi:type IV pilus assembly protein PilC
MARKKKPDIPAAKGIPRSEQPEHWSTKIPPLSRLAGKEKVSFFKYLAVMTEAGIPLERALIAIHNDAKSKLMHRVLHVMLNDVAAGEFLAVSLKKMPQLFSRLEIGLVEVGEDSGTLAPSLARVGESLEKSAELRSKVMGALLYPIIILFATGGVAVYLLFFLLPQITPMFRSLHVQLPWATRVLIAGSGFVLGNWIILGGLFLVLVVGGYFLLKVRRVHYLVDRGVLFLPVLGNVIQKVQVTQFTRVVGTLVKSGITIVDAFQIGATTLSNLVYRDALTATAAAIQEGSGVAEQLGKHPRLFPPFVTQMLSVGEETGKLDDSFIFVSNFSEREVDEAIKTLTTLLEPLLMLFIGAVVGFLAVAIISPIYELTKGIQQ